MLADGANMRGHRQTFSLARRSRGDSKATGLCAVSLAPAQLTSLHS